MEKEEKLETIKNIIDKYFNQIWNDTIEDASIYNGYENIFGMGEMIDDRRRPILDDDDIDNIRRIRKELTEKHYDEYFDGSYVEKLPDNYKRFYLDVCRLYAIFIYYLDNEIKMDEEQENNQAKQIDFDNWGNFDYYNYSHSFEMVVPIIREQYNENYTKEQISELNTNPLLIQFCNAIRPTIYKYGISHTEKVLSNYLGDHSDTNIDSDNIYRYFTGINNGRLLLIGLSQEELIKEIKLLEQQYKCSDIINRIVFSIINNDSKIFKNSLKKAINDLGLEYFRASTEEEITSCFVKMYEDMNVFLMNYDLGNINYISLPNAFNITDEDIDILSKEYTRVNILEDKEIKRGLK